MTDPVDVFAVRRQRILDGRLPPATVRLALSMCTLDEATAPTALRERGLTDLATAIETCTRFFVARVLRRASYAVHGHEFVPPAAEDERHRPIALQVEARLRAAIGAAFPPPVAGPAFAVREFEQAIAAFVTGQIGMGALAGVPRDHELFGHGVPDSSNHFCWAEAALYFLRQGWHTPFWRTALPALVGSAQFFAAHFWNRRARAWDAYGCGNLRSARTSSATVIAVIDHFYRGLSLPELADQFARVLAVALRDEPALGRPLPHRLEFP